MVKVVSCFDVKAGVFNNPFFTPTTAVAVRGFSDEINRSSNDNALFLHPEDFQLFCLGDFDEKTGRFSQAEIHTLLVVGSDLVKS